MKILLIFLDINSYHRDGYHFGLAYLSGFLQSKNHKVNYQYAYSQDQFGDILSAVKDFQPDVIGFTAVESQFIYVKRLSKLIREIFNGLIVCGGVYVTLFPEAVKDACDLDGVMIGESEYALLDLVENLKKGSDYKKTPNFCYYDKTQNKIVKNELLPLIKNLDGLPYPDRELFDYDAYLKKQSSVQFLFNRGCPFRCTYCSNQALGEVYGKKSNMTRYRTPNDCLEEIDVVLKKFNTNKPLHFVDDIFTLNRQWVFEFLEKYKEKFKRKPFICHTRSSIVDEELFAKLKDAGCFRVMMSIESGNDFIRNEVMNRNITQKQLLDSFKWARKYGIETSGVAMIGLPFETKEMVWDTIKTIAETKTTAFTLNVFYPYKGTKLYEVCKENDFLPLQEDESKERRESTLNLPTLSKEEIAFFTNNCDRLVMQFRPFTERIRFYVKKKLGNLLKRMGILEKLRNHKLFIKIRKAIYS